MVGSWPRSFVSMEKEDAKFESQHFPFPRFCLFSYTLHTINQAIYSIIFPNY